MKELHNLEDLFCHQLRDIYSAEKQLIDALPKLVEETASSKLKTAFAEHLEETKEHKKRLEQIGELLGIDLNGDTCEAMKGLIKETNSLISERAEPEVRDAGLIADAQCIEHYEISAYGTAVTYAQTLNHVEAAGKLQITLDEESAADEKLNGLAIEIINLRAKQMEAKPWH